MIQNDDHLWMWKYISQPQGGPRADRCKWNEMGPLQMAENKWLTGVITPINGVITLPYLTYNW